MISIVLTLFIAYCLLFILSLKLKDNSIVDVFWGFGFMIIALISFLLSEKMIPQMLITGLVFLWGIRLTSHIGFRKLKEGKEDPRYAKWREEWGSGWYFNVRSFLQVYMLQMILMFIVAFPILLVNENIKFFPFDLYPVSSDIGDGLVIYFLILCIGVSIALFGLIIESISDIQLKAFLKIKKPGQIFTTGMYRYSRHPNYFGESLFWLGISIIALPYSYFGIIGWIVITCLLLFVSGVPLQESRYAGRPEWEEYKKRTSVFIPWFPKK